jgi:hypothetical protein
MTISSETRKAGPFTGNGVTTAFPFSFKVFAQGEVLVVRANTATGLESVLVLGTDYTVSLNPNQNSNPGGTATLTAPLATGFTLVLTSALENLQPTDLTNQGGFYPAVINNALDRLTILVQQLAEKVARTLKLSVSAPIGVNPELPAPTPNGILGWNETASGITNLSPSTLATIVAYGTAEADVFTGDGTTTVFALSNDPGALNNLDVAIGGVTQLPGVDYTWTSGVAITFTTPPPNGVTVLVRYMQGLPMGTGVASQVSYLPSGTGAVATNVQSKLREFVSVKDFGAVGDGVTDDTVVIQAAVDSLGASGGTVVFPSGEYLCGSVINLPSDISLVAQGFAKLNLVNDDQYIFEASNKQNISLIGLHFDGGNIQGQNASGAYQFTGCSGLLTEKCKFTNFESLNPGVGKQAAMNYIQCEDVVITNNFVDGGGFRGFSMFSCTTATITNNFIRDCENTAISVRGEFLGVEPPMEKCIITGNIIENILSENGVSDGAIDVYVGAKEVIISGNIIQGFGQVDGGITSGSAIRANSINEVTKISQCIISNNVCISSASGCDTVIRTTHIDSAIVSNNIMHVIDNASCRYLMAERRLDVADSGRVVFEGNELRIGTNCTIIDSAARFDSTNYSVHGNIIVSESALLRGIRFSSAALNGVCSNNYIRSSAVSTTGIALDADQTNCVVSNNVCAGFRLGIAGLKFIRSVAANNSLSGPGFVAGLVSSGAGISLSEVKESQITSNVITSFTRQGLTVTLATNSNIAHNIFVDNGLADTVTEYNVLHVLGGAQNSIYRNKIRILDPASKALNLIATAANGDIIEDNDLRTSGYSGAAVSATGTGPITDRNRT